MLKTLYAKTIQSYNEFFDEFTVEDAQQTFRGIEQW